VPEPENPTHKRLQATAYANCDAADWIENWAAARGFGDETKFAMRLCVDELVTNLITYGVGKNSSDQFIELSASAEPDRARVVVIDDGIAFDVANAVDPGKEGSIEQATVGGRGIRLMRSFAERLEWRRVDGRNETTLTFKTAAAPDR